jgi:sporulation protein YlmC with PRC-barrel domain
MTRYIMKLAGALALGAASYSTAVLAQTTQPATSMPYVTEQPAGEWLAHVMFGAVVQNTAGEVVGDINDLVFSPAGHISTVVLGIGGILGMGEKNVAVPYSALSFKAGADGARIIVVAPTKDELKLAPVFKATEKTTYDAMKDKAIAMGKSASEKAGQLKDQAMKKVEDMKADAPKKP